MMRRGSDRIDIYNGKHRLELALSNLLQDPSICQENKIHIQQFLTFCRAENLSVDRQLLYLYKLTTLARLHRAAFEHATRDSIISLMDQIRKKGVADWTYVSYSITIKKFLKWLRRTDDCPPEVKWLKSTPRTRTTITADKLLTEQEVVRLAERAGNYRDKALVLVLYESGCRIGELLGLRIKDITFDEYGALLSVTGKTGHRRVRIVASCSELMTWINVHPDSKNRDAPVWVGIGTIGRNEALTYPAARSILLRLAKKTGLKKRIHPHLFRHSRATELLRKNYSLGKLPSLMGWIPGTKMLNVYSHLNGDDADEEVLRLHGLIPDKKIESSLTVRTCARCKERTSTSSRFCRRCGSPLDPRELVMEEKREAADKLLNVLLDDPEVRSLVAKKLSELDKERFHTVSESILEGRLAAGKSRTTPTVT